jgi:ribonuclease D
MMNSFPVNITKEQIETLPLTQFNGNIIVADTLTSYRGAMHLLKDHNCFGFDTETKPAFKKGVVNKVSLLQLATPDCCVIFRLNKIGLHEDLLHILNDKNKLKIGVAVKDDFGSLRKLKHFEPAGFVDLQKYCESFGIQDKSLKKLAAIILGCRISKSQQTSNWELDSLSQPQITYAATDAWVCIEMYNRLKKVEQKYAEINKNHTQIG